MGYGIGFWACAVAFSEFCELGYSAGFFGVWVFHARGRETLLLRLRLRRRLRLLLRVRRLRLLLRVRRLR